MDQKKSLYEHTIKQNLRSQQESTEFTVEELSAYDGTNGKPPYVAVNNVVYDLSGVSMWNRLSHFGLSPGADLTKQFMACHGNPQILAKLPVVGTLKQDN